MKKFFDDFVIPFTMAAIVGFIAYKVTGKFVK